MRRRKRWALSWVGPIVLAALLLVPLTLGGHHHDGGGATKRACATCIVVQHSAAVHAPPVGLDAPTLRAFSFTRIPTRIVAGVSVSPAHGRAPPPTPSRAA